MAVDFHLAVRFMRKNSPVAKCAWHGMAWHGIGVLMVSIRFGAACCGTFIGLAGPGEITYRQRHSVEMRNLW
jgi:hypothetical protein